MSYELHDPVRAVVKATQSSSGWNLQLSCGHWTFTGGVTAPASARCHSCRRAMKAARAARTGP